MAVEDFFPADDAKQTVEKPVRPKPKLSDLITIEKPGRPTPADQLIEPDPEESKKKAKRKRKRAPKASDKNVTRSRSAGLYTLIITEKPQAAAKIAAALGSSKKLTQGRVSYFEVSSGKQKIVVASAVGHLFNLTYSKGQKGWPIFKTEWQPSHESKKAAFTKPYFMLLKKLSKKAKDIIIATDFDNEGEVIGWNVLRYICGEASARRMKYSTLTKDELVSAYQNPLPELAWQQAYAGETRHILDWLYGINLSRALMSAIKTTGSFKILSIGRVQGPALKIIVDREREISTFVSQPFWRIYALVAGEKTRFKHPKDIFTKEELEPFKSIKTALASTTEKPESLPPLVPFDLTTLQREAYRLHRFSPSHTLKTAQKLYLNSIISYPRTSSQKIPQSIKPKSIIKALSAQFLQTKLCTRSKPIEGKKSDPAHPCFTKDTKVSLKDKQITMKEISKGVKRWKYDEDKKSYYSEIKIKDVLTYDHIKNEIKTSTAYQIWKTPTNTNTINLKDIGLKVTENHPIYAITKDGINYTEAGKLEKGDYIFRKTSINNNRANIKIKKDKILSAYSKNHQKQIKKASNPKITSNYIELEKFLNNLNMEKTRRLAKIIGFCLGDGHISFKKPSKNREEYPNVIFLGEKKDMLILQKDIKDLGFSSYLIKNKKNPKYSYLCSKNSLFGRALIALECPTGDKVIKKFDVPNWIKNSTKEIKAAFLGGLFSAELSKTRIHTKNPRDIRPYTFLQNKKEELKEPFIKYLENIRSLLSELKIETNDIKTRPKIFRKKDGAKTLEGYFDIKNNRVNLINFLSVIDFGYCEYKEKTYRKALAYLLYRERLIGKKSALKEKALKLYSKSHKYKHIAKELDISPHTIKGWTYYKKGYKENHVSIRDIKEYSKFEYLTPDGCKPVRISKISPHKKEDYVYDLEIKDTHNFFAEEILVHNCIFPTGEIKALSGDEEKLFLLIVKRFLSCFAPDASLINKRTLLTSNQKSLDGKPITFSATGLKIKEKGWLQIYPSTVTEQDCPTLSGTVDIEKLDFKEMETQPPKRFTPTSLITILEKKNLGTKATRSSIVDILFDRGYLDGRSIKATPLGLKLIEALEKYSPIIIDESLTSDIEKELSSILSANSNFEQMEEKIIASAKKTITKISKSFKPNEPQIGKQIAQGLSISRSKEIEENKIMPCPTCSSGSLRITYSKKTKRYFVSCSAYPECTQTYPLPPGSLIKNTGKKHPETKLPLLLSIKKGKRPWEFSFNPNWKAEQEKEKKE
tara:strand:- start:4456 stop:8244 length:3789 start_codon:yes stop_codon:yes gene_type:complete